MSDKIKANPALQEAIAKFNEAQKFKTFSQRHPELGKMVNCPVCSLRHRSIQKCEQKFAIDPKTNELRDMKVLDGLTGLTIRQILGSKVFEKKRIKPHYSKKRLQLLQRTIELFPHHDGIWPSTDKKPAEQVAMEVARREAKQELTEKRRAARATRQDMQHRSRRINRALLEGNSRIHR